jgi:hypothetical protein
VISRPAPSRLAARLRLAWRLVAIGLGLLVLSAPRASWGSPSSSELSLNAQLSRKITQDQLVRQAAYVLATEVTMDTDGYPLPGVPLTGGGPIGGGFIPSTSAAPKTDGYGIKLGYCAWDNGAVNNHAGYLPGTQSMAAITIAVVSPGADNLFQTTCAQVAAGGLAQAAGDDYVVAYTAGQIISGVQGSSYFGNPVANLAALTAINPSTLSDGQVRLVQATNTLYVYHAATGWTPINGGYFQSTGSGGDIYYSGGNVAIGQATATNALNVNSTSGGIPLGLSSTGVRAGIALLDSPGGATNGFMSFDKNLNATRLGASASNSSVQLVTGGGTVTVSALGVLLAPQGIVTSSLTSTGTLALSGTNGLSLAGPVTVTGGLTASALSATTISVGAYPVWHAGNFNPATKVDTATQVIAGVGLAGGGTLASNVTLQLATSGVTAGTYSNLQIDAFGRVTSARSLAASDVTGALTYTPVNKAGDTMSGPLGLKVLQFSGGASGRTTSPPEVPWGSAPRAR